MTDQSQYRYVFATVQYVSTLWGVDQIVRTPGALVHGKNMGTTLTLCGRSAVTWVKLWDQPFQSYRGERCSECRAALGGERQDRRVPGV
ncbi:MAG: hypothetical protein ACXVGR_00275 [Mycobacteriaceae bacterium]